MESFTRNALLIRVFTLMAVVVCLSMAASSRADIVYQIQGQTNGDAEAVGTITTDGTLGDLTIGNLLSSSVFVTKPGETDVELDKISFFTGISATATELTFALSPTNVLDFGNSPATAFWKLQASLIPGSIARRVVHPSDMAPVESILPGSTHVFATAVPEPASAALLAIGGMALLNFRGGRRRRHGHGRHR